MGCVVNATRRPLYPRERLGTYRTGQWMGPWAGLEECGKFKRHRDSIPGASRWRVSILIEISRPIMEFRCQQEMSSREWEGVFHHDPFLSVQSLAVSLRTARFNNKKIYMSLTLR
jgi:hypothetical protein